MTDERIEELWTLALEQKYTRFPRITFARLIEREASMECVEVMQAVSRPGHDACWCAVPEQDTHDDNCMAAQRFTEDRRRILEGER